MSEFFSTEAGRRAASISAEVRGSMLAGRAGEHAHQIIGELLATRLRQPEPAQVFAAVARSPVMATVSGPVRQALKQRLLCAVSLYFRVFVPGPEWKFEGAEVALKGVRLDLLWRGPGRTLRADELKTGRAAVLEENRALLEQVTRQVRAGQASYGSAFVGVRALLLAAPGRSYLMRPDTSTVAFEAW